MSQLNKLQQSWQAAGLPILVQEELKKYTTFHIGGPAALLCLPRTKAELCSIVQDCRREQVKYYILGLGSNVLFADEGYDGVVISTRNLAQTISVKDNCITADGGVPLSVICRTACEHSLSGLEFAYGIPGSLGGALYMNAGAYGGEMKDIAVQVECFDKNGNIRVLQANELGMGYRTSVFEKNESCILSAVLKLNKGRREDIQAKMEELLAKRKDKQPLEYPSAGSTFKRPEGAFAGALIEQCGLKGFRVGDAAVSEKHSGFVVNLGNATCEQVLQLTDKVQQIVLKETGFRLEKEIRVIR